MGSPISLLGNARAFARDYARDAMPAGTLWDCVDFVPAIIDAPLTGRGGWKWGSDININPGSPFLVGILMPFIEGDQLLAATSGQVYQVGEVDPFTLTARGATTLSVQNPVRYQNVAVHFDAAGNLTPQLWRPTDVVYSNAAHKHSKVGCVYKDMLVTGGAPGEEHVVRFSVPNTDLTQAASFDANSFVFTSLPLTALAALRGMVLCFHANSVERIRGSTPPHGAVEKGDMFVENALDHSGTNHPKTIAYWNDNVIYANEVGVHITDGATVRSLTSQGGISYYWRLLYEGNYSIVGTVFLDYYIVTIRHPPTSVPLPYRSGEDGGDVAAPRDARPPVPEPPSPVPRPPIPPLPPDLPAIRPPIPETPSDAYTHTLICDLNRRQWYRFTNINAVAYIAGGGRGMERIWGSIADSFRLARIGPTFYPNFNEIQKDDNGTSVKPRLETAWYRLSEEGRKRVRFAYLSYEVKADPAHPNPVRLGYVVNPLGTDQNSWLTSYINAGTLPPSYDGEYTRHRLPIYKHPYGIGFFLEVTGNTYHTKIYDIAVEASASERSRI